MTPTTKTFTNVDLAHRVLRAAALECGENFHSILAGSHKSHARVYAYLAIHRQFPDVFGSEIMRLLGIDGLAARGYVKRAHATWNGEYGSTWFEIIKLNRILRAMEWPEISSDEYGARTEESRRERAARALPTNQPIQRYDIDAAFSEARQRIVGRTSDQNENRITALALIVLMKRYPDTPRYAIATAIGVRDDRLENVCGYVRDLFTGVRQIGWFNLDLVASILSVLGWPSLTKQEISDYSAHVKEPLQNAEFKLFVPPPKVEEIQQPVKRREFAPVVIKPERVNRYLERRYPMRSDNIVSIDGGRK